MSVANKISSINSSTASLNTGQSFTGVYEDIYTFNDITVFVKTSRATTLYVDFSTDGVNAERTVSFAIPAATGSPHKLARITQYMRVRLDNSSGSTSTVVLQTLLSMESKSHLTTNLSATITDTSDAEVSRSIIVGRTDGGLYRNVPITSENHLEVAIHGPRNPFGSIHTENLYPSMQHDAVYGIDTEHQRVTLQGTGQVTSTDSLFTASTGTTALSFGAFQSRERLRYRPGQGMVGRFTAKYSAPATSSYLVAGFGHAEDGFYFGYKDTSFGIIYNNRGKREVQTLTVSVASSHTESITITIADTPYSVPVTNSGSTVKTAYEIATFSSGYTGWKAEQVGSTVVFVADSAGNKSGAFTLSGATSATGSFVETQAGQNVSESFIAQTAWNGDKMDGTGASGITLDPTKLNVYQIKIQYLGAGAITFEVEAAFAGNNPDFIVVHCILLPNTLSTTSLGNPSFPFTLSATSAGSTTDISVSCGSYAGFIEGQKKLQGNRYSFVSSSAAVDSSSYRSLFSIRNTRYFKGRTNQAVVNILDIHVAQDHTRPTTFYILKDATLAGTPNFAQYTANSVCYLDTAATTATISDNKQILWSGAVGDTGSTTLQFSDDIAIQPGDVITIAAKTVSGTPSAVVASLNVREDQ